MDEKFYKRMRWANTLIGLSALILSVIVLLMSR